MWYQRASLKTRAGTLDPNFHMLEANHRRGKEAGLQLPSVLVIVLMIPETSEMFLRSLLVNLEIDVSKDKNIDPN